MDFDILAFVGGTTTIVLVIIFFGILALLIKCYQKVEQGHALVRNGIGGTKVSFSGIVVIPIIHKLEWMDITLKRVIIERRNHEGLICMDNMRADIVVTFFVRVNKTAEDVLKVAQSIGCLRASHEEALRELFEAKFAEALKTVGKQFNFVDLYNSRERFKEEILKIIGTDLNGFVLDDAAIDYLEQTQLEMLDPENILDSEGIKKITDLTARQMVLSNKIRREKEKTIVQQDVEAREATLELERQQADAENRQKREVESVIAREEAETKKIQQEERLKAERARITTEEEIFVAEENKERQIIVARRNKERTDAVEGERVEKDRLVEATERERIVELARIEKDKAIEVERQEIQNVIRERVKVEKTVVEEQERIKDTEAFAGADRERRVTLTYAETEAEESLVKTVKGAEADKRVAELKADENMYRVVKSAEADKQAADMRAEQRIVEAEAHQAASEKEAQAKKLLAEGITAEKAAAGLAEVRVTQARAVAIEEQGTAEANVQRLMYSAEAKGIEEKANAMKLLDGVGREHEEFKLRLSKEKEVEIAAIQVGKDIAGYQAQVVGRALESATVDIVGGDSDFFDRIVNAVAGGKAIDRYVTSGKVLSDVKETFFNADPEYFQSQLKRFFDQFGVKPGDVKDLTVSAALSKLLAMAGTAKDKEALHELLAMAERTGMTDHRLSKRGVPKDESTE